MLQHNFIYAYSKEAFLRELTAGNILDEAVVFIEDTQEIWNNGTYFASNEIITAIKNDIQALKDRSLFKIVQSLPETPTENTIYLIYQTNDGSEEYNSNMLTEYIYIDNRWEKLGEIQLEPDLSDYLKIADNPFEKGTGTDSAVQKNQYGVNTAGNNAFASGYNTTASGDQSHTEGYMTQATAKDAHAEGHSTIASDHSAHAEGYETESSGWGSHSEGLGTQASGAGAHAEGATITVDNVLYKTIANNDASHAEGRGTLASNKSSHAEGTRTTASGQSAHAEGDTTTASADNAHSEGCNTTASGWGSHTEGYGTQSTNSKAHAEGDSTIASGEASHAEGVRGSSSGYASHKEGFESNAYAAHSHVEGFKTAVWSDAMDGHAEGHETIAANHAAHAEGTGTYAGGWSSHSEGLYTKATNHNGEHAEGKYNKSNTGTIHSVGIGTSDNDRKNAHEITAGGKHYILNVGGYDGTNPSNANDLATIINGLLKTSDIAVITDDELEEMFNNYE